MKIFLTVVILFLSTLLFSQEIQTTHSFAIIGKVKSPVTISFDDLTELKVVNIGDLIVTNHLGEERGTAKSLKGVLLRDVFQKIEIDVESPKFLSEYFFICRASDNYTVVFSWNEIFNTVVGEGVFIVTEKDGRPMTDMEENILMVSVRDIRTGRRHVKSLSSIEVARAK
ncbi:MAG TPA: hypothetical protein VFW11_03195 [Cyclobacteriaceae bacterium]|nr:hypothetical protein [Cyclobacteriaceae bacterium]